LIWVLGGFSPTHNGGLIGVAGRMGRWKKPAPQFGQTFFKTSLTQDLQNVHSKLQIMASAE
jgi:hypothetical protein